MAEQRKAPKDATNAEMCRLRRDHTEFGDFCLMTDGYTVWLSEQAKFESPKQHFELSKSQFNRLLRWYLKPAKLSRKVKR